MARPQFVGSLNGAAFRNPLTFHPGSIIRNYDALESALQKIKATLSSEYLSYLDNIQKTFHFEVKSYQDYGKFGDLIQRISDAARSKMSIEIVYFTMSRKKESKRLVDPYNIWFYGGSFYLIGYCHTRKEIRLFAIHRIKRFIPRITISMFQKTLTLKNL